MKLSYVLNAVVVFSVVLVQNGHCLSFSIGDVGKSIISTGVGTLEKVPDVIPTPDGLFQLGKNAVAGYPFDVAFKIINTFCR